MQDSIEAHAGHTVFCGPRGVETFRATVIASALRLYADTGMKANRAYTPTAMLRAAAQITGKTYKRGEYHRAADDLTAWARHTADEIHAANGGAP